MNLRQLKKWHLTVFPRQISVFVSISVQMAIVREHPLTAQYSVVIKRYLAIGKKKHNTNTENKQQQQKNWQIFTFVSSADLFHTYMKKLQQHMCVLLSKPADFWINDVCLNNNVFVMICVSHVSLSISSTWMHSNIKVVLWNRNHPLWKRKKAPAIFHFIWKKSGEIVGFLVANPKAESMITVRKCKCLTSSSPCYSISSTNKGHMKDNLQMESPGRTENWASLL